MWLVKRNKFYPESNQNPLVQFETMLDSLGHSIPSSFHETKDRYTVHAIVPGVNKKDISIDYLDGYIQVDIESNKTDVADDVTVHYSEWNYPSLSRRYYVGDVDFSSVNATLKDGELTIDVKKAESEKPRSIAIT